MTFQALAQSRSEQRDLANLTTQDFWELKNLYQSPPSKIINSNRGVESILFQSVDYRGRPTEVFAYCSNPDMLTGKISSKKYPGVMLLHGGGGKAFQEWVEKWAAQGYAAIDMDFGGKDGEGI
ncbi:hypothetical protein [Dyadobacter tibetensis]|uniref:hypothetical protein n=1 Tax=Dyadobacter tibetensis TaxID=1211851 RepID=UPI000471C74F|nr:hypothetical protein [Dyadobacter tibetensis]